MRSKLEVVQTYFSLLEAFETDPAAYQMVLHPDIEQTEYPNLLTSKTKTRNFASLVEGMKAGKGLLLSQRYEIQNTIESSDYIVVETVWRGTIRADAGPFKANQELMATFCVVMQFLDGLIYRQRNYDCFEAFAWHSPPL